MNIKEIYKKVATAFVDALYPKHIKCLGCRRDIEHLNIYDVCDKCRPQIKLNNKRTCLRCGKNVFANADYCFNCKGAERHFDKAAAPLLYVGLISAVIKRFKYMDRPFLADSLARILANAYAQSEFEVDVVIPVPMHPDKVIRRGYNQAELLARAFCDIVGLPLETEQLMKIIDTDTQTHKSRDEREELGQVYALKDPDFFRGKRVLIIDDVITTGATLDACASVLNASKVYGLAVAHSVSKVRSATTPQVLKNRKFGKKVVL